MLALATKDFRKKALAKLGIFLPRRSLSAATSSTSSTSDSDNHIARQLSKNTITAEQKRKWKKMLKHSGGTSWSTPPLFETPLQRYEFEALKKIHAQSFESNVLLEVRDVRLPASTHHPSFTRLAAHRTHLICYTHADLIDQETKDRVLDWTFQGWPNSKVAFCDSRENRGPAKESADSFQFMYDRLIDTLETVGSRQTALTVGVPNVGKSSLLQSLLRVARKERLIPKSNQQRTTTKRLSVVKPPVIHDTPGKTRVLTEYLLRTKPRAFFLDVPGITPPPAFFESRPEAWAGYGASNLLTIGKKEKIDNESLTLFCEYVLFCINRDGNFAYVPKLGLDKPTEDIEFLLEHVSRKYADKLHADSLRRKRCQTFLKLYNTGNLGSVVLDDLSKPWKRFRFEDFGSLKKKEVDVYM